MISNFPGEGKLEIKLIRSNSRLASDVTVRRRLRDAGIINHKPYVSLLLTAQCRQCCLSWTRQHLPVTRIQCQVVLFSDESRFNLHHHDGRRREWRRRGERLADNCIIQHYRFGGDSVHRRSGISFLHRSPLSVFREPVNVQIYISDAPQPIVVLELQRHKQLLVCQHDYARAHTAWQNRTSHSNNHQCDGLAGDFTRHESNRTCLGRTWTPRLQEKRHWQPAPAGGSTT